MTQVNPYKENRGDRDMKIEHSAKDKSLKFIPEGDIDCYQLGRVFANKNHTISTTTPNTIISMEIKIADIWAYLQLLKV